MGKIYFILAHHIALGVHCVGTERRGNTPPPTLVFDLLIKSCKKTKGKAKSNQGFTGNNTDKPDSFIIQTK